MSVVVVVVVVVVFVFVKGKPSKETGSTTLASLVVVATRSTTN